MILPKRNGRSVRWQVFVGNEITDGVLGRRKFLIGLRHRESYEYDESEKSHGGQKNEFEKPVARFL